MTITIKGVLPRCVLAAGLAFAAGRGVAQAEQVVYSFQYNGADGFNPIASLIEVGGVFYGTTQSGGTYNMGTIFSLTPSGTETVLHSFQGDGLDGIFPRAALLAVDGVLYGTTLAGGHYGSGIVYRLKQDGTEQVLHTFTGPDGSGPTAALIDVGGTLYGTTIDGGAYGEGVVFSIAPDGSEAVLYSFEGGSDGGKPFAPLLYLNGTLYGTTHDLGAYGDGTVFSLTLGGAETVLHSFGNSGDGVYPDFGGLIAVNGVLYGTTSSGGDESGPERHHGTVFSITQDGTEHTLYSFDGADGAVPIGGLLNVNGVLYGTTAAGTARNRGTVFSITPAGEESVLFSFGGVDGAYPYSTLLSVGSGLYGTTFSGGATGYGTVFKIK